MKLVGVLILSAISGLANANGVKEKPYYGSQISRTDAVELTEAITKIAEVKGKEILVTGTVEKVCSNKGCWMAIKSGEHAARVTFKDYGFFVPESLKGKRVLAQGQLSEQVLEVSEAKHFAKDAGQSKEEVAAIKEPQKEFRFVASGIAIAKGQ